MEVIEREAFEVVGIKIEAHWEELHTKMPEAWKTLKGRIHEITGRKNEEMVDLSLQVNDGIYTQLIGVEIEGEVTIPIGMEHITIPSEVYINHTHEGTLQEIAQSFGKMYDWAKSKGIEAGDFKIDQGYTKRGVEKSHDLYIKVLK